MACVCFASFVLGGFLHEHHDNNERHDVDYQSFKSSIIQLWANYFAIGTTRIDPLPAIQIEFLLNGALGAYRSLDPNITFEQVLSRINALIGTPLDKAVIETITGIFQSYSNAKTDAV